MAAPTNTATTLTTVGIREDLEEALYRVAPEKTPFTNVIGKVKVSQPHHEWQTEDIDAVDDANYQLEGDDVGTLDAENVTDRIGNYCQIFRKTGGVSRTDEIAKKAGRKSEMNRQRVLKVIAMRRDMERRFMGNYGSNNQSGGTPRKTAGLNAFLTSNVSNGVGGTNGGFSGSTVTAATPGTDRTFTADLLNDVLSTAFDNGATPSLCYMPSKLKQVAAKFIGNASSQATVTPGKQRTIVAGMDIYDSDFGLIKLLAHQYALKNANCALIVDPDMVAVGTYDGIKFASLGKTGDSDKFMVTAEKCLVVKNEKAHAVIRAIAA